ncbi:MerR family transcriptional regulator [Synechococcus sp. ATX 2A4]|uniref:MerR family transcriptional regulator n=1 Tax=Synechococcus sp. ATX 2A4 TaxID=2823727 RepID=UPI0020CDB158|nr:MerR family transcriptional regulator [Synechococcus sp. ATX 2A4]MCP9885875.1 MerR family transcriptional regulator [Synechococcus sp. ATX 2A4]
MVKVSTPADAHYGLEDLLLAAGELLGEEISSRTVRLYATQGLIDRPGKAGRSAVYGHRHLLQLVLVRALARRGLSLSAIAPLCALDDVELEQQLEQLDGVGAAATAPSSLASSSALDYLRDLQSSEDSTADDLSASTDLPASAAASIHLSGSAASLASRLGKAQPFSRMLGMLSDPLSSQVRAERPSSGSRTGGSSREASSRWRRYTLAPGIEVHVRESVSLPPAGPRREQWLNSLLARFKQLIHDPSG